MQNENVRLPALKARNITLKSTKIQSFCLSSMASQPVMEFFYSYLMSLFLKHRDRHRPSEDPHELQEPKRATRLHSGLTVPRLPFAGDMCPERCCTLSAGIWVGSGSEAHPACVAHHGAWHLCPTWRPWAVRLLPSPLGTGSSRRWLVTGRGVFL